MNSTSGLLAGFMASSSLSAYSTAGENGIFDYFDGIGCYHEFFNMQYENEPDSILECLRNDKKYGLPEVIETQLLKIYSESWDAGRIKDFLRIENQFLNVFVALKPVDKEHFKYQINFLLKRNDGAYFITNILTITKENDVMSTDGFNDNDRGRIFTSLEVSCCVEEEMDPLQVELNKLEDEDKRQKLVHDEPKKSKENKNSKNRLRKILIVILSCCGIGIFGLFLFLGKKVR